MSKGQVFRQAPPAPHRRSAHNLSASKIFTGDFGRIYPVYVTECIPGDHHRITADCVIRFAPLATPAMHEINATLHYFFVPYRLLWDDWEEFITGGPDGTDESVQPAINDIITSWDTTHLLKYLYEFDTADANVPLPASGNGYDINAYRLRAYNLIYQDYYRDENLIDEIDITDINGINDGFYNRAWTKDYFTSALPFQQRGVAPVLPSIIGEANITFTPPDNEGSIYNIYRDDGGPSVMLANPTGTTSPQPNTLQTDNVAATGNTYPIFAMVDQATLAWMNSAQISADVLPQWDISDLRTAWQTQRYLEQMALVGARYTEMLKGIWGVAPRDERLQRPEYIGGAKQPIIISEVLQTSESNETYQGNMAGHGISADVTRIGTYHVKEYGLIMGLLSVMPAPAYNNGVPKAVRTESRYDYPNPYFMHLSEQPILSSELCYTGNTTTDNDNWGFQGIWDNYRIKQSTVAGLMSTDFANWNLVRDFGTTPPTLSQEFIEVDAITGGGDNPLKRIFAATSEPGMFITAMTHNRAVRKLPWMATPGLVDH